MPKIIIYDFDGTLTPNPVADLEILEKCGYEKPTCNFEYINKVTKKIKDENMNIYEATYKTYIETVKNSNYKLINENIALGADKFKYNKGFFEFLDYTNNKNVKNYIVSSSLKVLLDNTKVASLFEDIYATTFKYDDNIVTDIDYLLTDVEKVNVIKEILSLNNLDNCNDVIYIGDGLTDYPAMEYVTKNGGHAIYIYYDEFDKNLEIMKDKGIVSIFSDADYTKDGLIYSSINKIFNF